MDNTKIIESLQFEITTIERTIIQLSKVKAQDDYSHANLKNSIDKLKDTKNNLERIVQSLQNQNLNETTLAK